MFRLSNKEQHFIKNLLLAVVLGSFIGLFNYLFNIFVARYTVESVFGVFSAAMGIIYLLQIPALSIQTILTKTVGEQRDVNWKKFKLKSLLIFTAVGFLFSVIFYLSKDYILDISNIPSESILPLTLVFLFSFISPISKGFLLGKEKIVTVNLLLLLETTSKFILGYIAIKMGGDITLLILATALPAVVFGLIALPFIKLDSKKEKITKKPTLNYKELLLMTGSFLLLNTPFTLDLILVNPNFRAEYSALALVGKIVFFAATTISSVMFARLVNQEKSKKERKTLLISLFATFACRIRPIFAFLYFQRSIIFISLRWKISWNISTYTFV